MPTTAKTNPQYSTRMPLTYNAQITMGSCMHVRENLSIQPEDKPSVFTIIIQMPLIYNAVAELIL